MSGRERDTGPRVWFRQGKFDHDTWHMKSQWGAWTECREKVRGGLLSFRLHLNPYHTPGEAPTSGDGYKGFPYCRTCVKRAQRDGAKSRGAKGQR